MGLKRPYNYLVIIPLLILLTIQKKGYGSDRARIVLDVQDDLIKDNSGAGDTKKPKFVATKEWQDIQEGQSVPAGLHYRMNLETGRKEAKLMDVDVETDIKDSSSVIATNDNQSAEDEVNPIDNETVQKVKKQMEKMKMNRDLEHIQVLMANYRNASHQSIQIAILDDLEYYMHQVDNAVDFVTIGGLNQIIKPSLLDNVEPEIAAKAAVLLGSAAQSNPTVQKAILEADLLSPLINLFSRKESENCCLELKNRAVYAISCIVRGNVEGLQKFVSLDGFKEMIRIILFDENQSSSTIRLKLKALSFIAYAWREGNIHGLEPDSHSSIYSELSLEDTIVENEGNGPKNDLISVCHFFLNDEMIYRERKYPFEEEDSLQWIEQVIEMIMTFIHPCHSIWIKNEKVNKMLAWISHADQYLASQIIKEGDEDIKEMLLDIQSTIKEIMVRGERLKEAQGELSSQYKNTEAKDEL